MSDDAEEPAPSESATNSEAPVEERSNEAPVEERSNEAPVEEKNNEAAPESAEVKSEVLKCDKCEAPVDGKCPKCGSVCEPETCHSCGA